MEGKFKINVPYNDAYLLAKRKKTNIFSAVMLFLVAVLFVVITVIAGNAENSSTLACVIFAGFAVASLASGVYFVCAIKPSAKNATKKLTFNFYEDMLEVLSTTDKNGNSKTKKLHAVAYASYKDKQYISKIVEDENGFEIEILTGTMNLMPQYKKLALPKSYFKDEEELEDFKSFIKGKVSKYKVKETKSKN